MAKYIHILDRSAQAERKTKAFAEGKHKPQGRIKAAITSKEELNVIGRETQVFLPIFLSFRFFVVILLRRVVQSTTTMTTKTTR